jgi:hypothetical protein
MDMPTSPEKETPVPTLHRNASWGAIITIVIILAMIVIGAFYAWGKRIDEERASGQIPGQPVSATASTTY